jgi:hypothetical protein
MQILRRHATYLISPKKTKLTAGQCYHFFAGWLPWLADGVNLLFNLAALCWSVAMLLDPLHFDPPIVIFSLLPLSLFVFKVGKLFYLYRTRLKTSMGQTIAAAVAGLALSHTIAKAVLAGFVTRDKPFFRTPKLANTSAILKVLAACVDELFMMGALSCAAITIGATQKLDTLDIRLWVMVLAMQSLPYGATLLMALISALPQGRKNRLAAAVQSSDADSGPGLMN